MIQTILLEKVWGNFRYENCILVRLNFSLYFVFDILGLSVNDENTPFMPKPFCMYTGHTSDLLDVSWSKNYFVLSSSMDKTVRLWHISRKECLCCFQHIDFVTAICFHPKDDRYGNLFYNMYNFSHKE